MKPNHLLSDNDIIGMKNKLNSSQFGKRLFWQLMNNAEWLLRVPVPTCPPAGPNNTQKSYTVFGNSTYSEDYLLSHESFDILTSGFEGVVLTLGLAARLTSDDRYWHQLEKWVSEFNQWENWGPIAHPCDQFAVRIVSGMIYYNLLSRDAVSIDVMPKIRIWYQRILDSFGGTEQLEIDKLDYIGNHSWFNISMLGTAALFLDDSRVADLCVQRIGNLTDWAIGEDGDYIDTGHYIIYALRYALPFLYLYEMVHTKPTVNWYKVHRAIWFALDTASDGIWIAPLLRIAALMKDQSLAYAATKAKEPTCELVSFESSRLFVLSDTPWSCLFYDPEIVPCPSYTIPVMRYYKNSGYLVYESVNGKNSIKAILYAGPHSGKSYFNQGFLSLTFNGQRILENPAYPCHTYISAHASVAHYCSNLSDMVCYIDGLGQCAGSYPYEWPDNRYTHHRTETPIGHIINTECSKSFHAVADISRAYSAKSYDFSFWGNPTHASEELLLKDANRVNSFLRTVDVIDNHVVSITDHIKFPESKSFSVDLFFPTSGEINLCSEHSLVIRFGRIAVTMKVTASSPFKLSYDKYYMSERLKRICISFQSGSPLIDCSSVFSIANNE